MKSLSLSRFAAVLLLACASVPARAAVPVSSAPGQAQAQAGAPASTPAPQLASPRALVLDADTGKVLLAKRADQAASIASMTKLMTAMVVLDARLDANEVVRIGTADLDTIKGTYSGVPVGAAFSRGALLRLALLSSDNRAAAALARTYPGGHAAFLAAVARKSRSLGLRHTVLVEPTGLSPKNRASARDVAKVLKAAAGYPFIASVTSQPEARIAVNGTARLFRNTNKLVGQPGWRILASKTGYIREAGVCVTMLVEAAGRRALVVLMGARTGAARAQDAHSIRRWLAGETVAPKAAPGPRGKGRLRGAKRLRG
jgi:D-alanyl-D-alanine carboxypeptidase/D-alanyl-D-alanine endopeptidase (penicillin-binding protein 7)